MKRLLFIIGFMLFSSISAQKKWSLEECINYAKEHNFQVIGNIYNAKIREQQLKIAHREKLPSIQANWNHTANFGQQQFGSFIQRNDSYSNNANVSAFVSIYNHQKLEKNLRKTQYELKASEYDLEIVINNISLQIAEAYLSILLNKEIVKIGENTWKNAEHLYNKAKITTEIGTTSTAVLAEAQAAYARETQNLNTAKINLKRSLFHLAQILQLESYKNFDIADLPEAYSVSAPLYSADKILNTAYEQQPQIKAAEQRLKASETETEIAKTAFYPSISGSLGIGTFYFNSLNRGRDPEIFKQYKDNFGQQVALSINIPIFNRGITKIQVEQSKINESITKNTLAQQKQEVKQDVRKAQFDAENHYENYLATLEAEKSSKIALDLAEKSYTAGKSSIYDLNIARNNYANTRSSTAQAKFNYLFSLKLLAFYSGTPLSL